MKVLLASPLPPPVGGIATVTANLIGYLQSDPAGIELVLCNTTLKLRSITSQSFIVRIFTGFFNSIKIFLEIRYYVNKERPDLIHLASSSSFALFKDYLIIFIAKYYRIPIIIHWHFGRIPALAVKRNWEWKLLKHIIGKSTVSIVIDSKSFNTLEKLGFTNVKYIPNPLGLDVEQKVRSVAGSTNHRQTGRLIFAGHIVRSKGVYELAEACSKLSLVTELLLIGPCEENVKRDLIAIAGKREDGKWLNLIGELPNDRVLEQMFISPILALPSYTEGFPNAVLEGMAMGCAILATSVGAIPDMLDINGNRPCGICVPPRQVELLAAAIQDMLLDVSGTEKMGKNGVDQVLNNFTIKKIADDFKQLWDIAVRQNTVLKNKNRKDVVEANVSSDITAAGIANQDQLAIKILLVSPLPPPVGGIASWTPNIIKYYENSAYHIQLTLLNSALKGKSITSNSLFKRYYSGIYNFLWINLEFRKLVKFSKPELIHLVSSSSLALYKDYLLIGLAKVIGIPVVMHWRFGRIPSLSIQDNWEWRLLKKVISKSELSIVVDSKSYYTLQDAGFTNVVYIPNPLRLDLEQKSRAINERHLQRQQGKLIFVGHIVRSKGVYELVDACSQLSVIKELSLIGPCEDDVSKELRVIAGHRDNGEWLNLFGELNSDQVLEQIINKPVLVLPSYTEGFPNAVLEGMAMGCAIIATDVGAIPEMLDVQGSRPCGICVPPRQVEKLREAIRELMLDPLKIEEMGKNGIDRVLTHYTMEKIAEQYSSVWKSTVHK